MANLSSTLGRRPWKIDQNLNNLKTVKAVRSLNGIDMRSLIRVKHETMDGTHRSIAYANLKRAMQKAGNMLKMEGKIRRPTLADGRITRDLVQRLRRWAKWWRTRGGVTVLLRMVTGTSATPNILGLMKNTMRNARKPTSEDD